MNSKLRSFIVLLSLFAISLIGETADVLGDDVEKSSEKKETAKKATIEKKTDDDTKQSDEEKVPQTYFFIGVNSFPVHGSLRAHLKLPEKQGLIVHHIFKESVALGVLKKYDILLTASGQKLKSSHGLRGIVQKAGQSGETIKFSIIRNGKEETVTVPTPKKVDVKKFRRHGRRSDHHHGRRPANAKPLLIPERLGGKELEIGKKQEEILKALRKAIPKNGSKFYRESNMKFSTPEGYEISIRRVGKKPAKITVKDSEGKVYTTTSDKLSTLPEKLQTYIKPFLEKMDAGQFETIGGSTLEDFQDLEKQIKEMNAQIKALTDAIDSMEKK